MTGQRDPVTPPPAARMPRASWYWGAAALLMALWLLLAPPQAGQELPYSQFKAMLHAGRVIDLQLDERQISGKLRPATGGGLRSALDVGKSHARRYS